MPGLPVEDFSQSLPEQHSLTESLMLRVRSPQNSKVLPGTCAFLWGRGRFSVPSVSWVWCWGLYKMGRIRALHVLRAR